MALSVGGGQRMLAELAEGLARRGHEVIVPMPLAAPVLYPLEQARIFRSGGPLLLADDYPQADIILSNHYSTVPSASDAARTGKGIHVHMTLGYEPLVWGDREPAFRSYATTPSVIAISHWLARLVEEIHGIRAMGIVPPGVGNGFTNRNLRTEGKIRILSMLRLDNAVFWYRDQEGLLRILRSVKAAHPEVEIELFIPSAEAAVSPRWQALPRECGFLVRTPQGDSELCEMYSAADIFVSSTMSEGSGLPSLEAMRCGAAIAARYAGGNMDYLRPGENCLLSYLHQDSMKNDILDLIRDASLRKKLARAGEKDSLEWTWERSVIRLEEILKSVLRQK